MMADMNNLCSEIFQLWNYLIWWCCYVTVHIWKWNRWRMLHFQCHQHIWWPSIGQGIDINGSSWFATQSITRRWGQNSFRYIDLLVVWTWGFDFEVEFILFTTISVIFHWHGSWWTLKWFWCCWNDKTKIGTVTLVMICMMWWAMQNIASDLSENNG